MMEQKQQTMKLTPYRTYKPSGVEWLGDMPAHWEVRRLKQVASLNPSRIEARTSLVAKTSVTFLPMERVAPDGRIDSREVLAAFHVWNGFTYFRRDDVLVAKITPCFENGKGACLESLPTEIGFGSTEFHVLRGKSSISPQFLYRLTTVSEFRRLGAETMNGAAGQQRVPADFVANYPIPLPPLPEQTAIVRYLDHADGRIRRYIDAKQKLIRLLEEEKQAVIHHAVTRGLPAEAAAQAGLDPNIRLKPSGVEWLGDVPAHWEVRRLKQVASLNPSRIEARTSLVAKTSVTFLPMERVAPDGRIDSREVLAAFHVWNGFTYFRRDDVLVAKITPCFENGKGACLESLPTEIGFGSTEFHVLRGKSSISPQFLYRLTTVSEFRRLGAETMNGAAGQQRVPADFVANYPIPLPPLPEQTAIVKYLDKATADINTAIARARREIDLLREYRTRLIADVVTGKLDVREAAAQPRR